MYEVWCKVCQARQALILEVKGNSLDDGPGIRTVIFVKGCPLSCSWCHNPESKRADAELSFSRRDCIDCGLCRTVCANKALDADNPLYIDRNACRLCFACVDVCPTRALSRVGKPLSIDAIVETALGDALFYSASGGGVTLSGGEVTMFPAFAGELLRRLKAHGIHTLVETCGHFNPGQFEARMLPHIDTIYFDLKLFRTDQHKFHCGVGNELILSNFKNLYAKSRNGHFTVLPRIPLIPGISDTEENLAGFADFLVAQKAERVQLLPYNPTWLEKNQKLGIDVEDHYLRGQTWQDDQKLQFCESIFTGRGITLE